ncbi:MAG TPA: flavodoxin domain-containing protein [Enteractinococcus sp.]
MGNAIVIYETKYGSTRQYAQWIAGALNCEIYARTAVEPNELNAFDTVIYGGPIYTGGVRGVKFIRYNFDILRHKNLVLFTCGLSDPTDPDTIVNIYERLGTILTRQMIQHMKIFHLRGAIDYSKLNVAHRAIMAMVVRPVKKKYPASRTAEEQHMLDTYGKAVDFTDRNAVNPIVDYVRAL